MLREIKVYRDLMGANDEWAGRTRELLAAKGVALFNLIGSPGAGKTALLEALGARWRPKPAWAVLEGDVETTRDAERLQRLDIPVSQLLTGGACHLEAKLVHHALKDLDLDALELVFVENVGNLVCPAEFDIGERAKIAVLSVTEGEDKALKYPLLFREAQAAVLTKTDLLPHLNYRLESCLEALAQVNAQLPVFQVSAATGSGLEPLTGWIADRLRETKAPSSAQARDR